MPSQERGFLIGSIVGPIAGVAAVLISWLPSFVVGLITLQLDSTDLSYCDATSLTVELAIWSVLCIPSATVLAWFVAKQRNADREPAAQASTRAAAAAGFLGATLVLLFLIAGAGAVICTDPLAV